ncbi:MAG: tetratricopeptide repeat protein [Desulfobacterota bacterium]|nr:tetratricopeptide repeat protein [Thermodesulfobacteriota bacterium]
MGFSRRSLHIIIIGAVLWFFFAHHLSAAESVHDMMRTAADFMAAKKYSEALSVYERIIAAHPTCPEAYRNIVTCYSDLGNPHGAIKYMDGLVLEYPHRAEAHYGLGVALYAVGQYDRAAACFAKAVELNPELAAAWNNAAVIQHFIKHDYAAARRYYEKAIAISTRTGNTAVRDIARKNLENLPRPEDLRPMSLEEFLNTFIARAEAHDETGIRLLVLSQKNICPQAFDWLIGAALRAHASGLVGEEATSAELARILAHQYGAVHGSEVLMKKYQEYATLDPERKKAAAQGEKLMGQGLERERQGMAADAVPLYDEARSCFHRSGFKEQRGYAELALGDACRAAQDYRSARAAYRDALTTFMELKDEPRKALALASLGMTESLLGNGDEALEYLNRALAIYKQLNDTQAVEKVRRNIEIIRTKRSSRAAPAR